MKQQTETLSLQNGKVDAEMKWCFSQPYCSLLQDTKSKLDISNAVTDR